MADLPRSWSADRVDPQSPGEELERFWRENAERRGNAFMTPEWLRAPWGVAGAEPALVVVRDGDDAVRGLLPFTGAAGGRLRLGSGSRADRQEPVCDPADDAAVARAAASELGFPSSRGLIELANVDVGAGWTGELAAALPGRHALHAGPETSLPYLACAEHGSWEDYLDSRSSSFRKRLRRLQRRLDEREVELRRTESAASLAGDLEAFFDLHDRRWGERGGSTIAPDHRELLGIFTTAALERGWLRLWTLRAQGAAVASWLGWSLGDRYAFYNGGFDPEWGSLSPGIHVHARVIEDAFAEGASEVDFLLGEEAYKSQFADSSRSIATAVIVGARRAARVSVASEFAARRLARRLPDRVRHGGPARAARGLLSRA